MFVPIAILILAGTGIVSQAFAATTITINTDRDTYEHTDTITLTGIVDPVDQNEMPVAVMLINQRGSIVTIAQLYVNNDGTFSGEIALSPKNSLTSDDGIYEITANYAMAKATTSIELVNAIETSQESVMGQAVTGQTGEVMLLDSTNLAGLVEYDLTCDADPSFFVNEDDDSIVIYLDSISDGILTVTLHEELIKPFEDGTFVVVADNQEMQDFTQVGNTLTIPCLAGTEKIEIHGSWAIPEFGVIAAMILAVAVVSIIVVTAKTRLSIVPRY